MNKLVRFTQDDHEGVEISTIDVHAISVQGDGESTVCGMVYADYNHIESTREKGGITCEDCLTVIKKFKSIKL